MYILFFCNENLFLFNERKLFLIKQQKLETLSHRIHGELVLFTVWGTSCIILLVVIIVVDGGRNGGAPLVLLSRNHRHTTHIASAVVVEVEDILLLSSLGVGEVDCHDVCHIARDGTVGRQSHVGRDPVCSDGRRIIVLDFTRLESNLCSDLAHHFGTTICCSRSGNLVRFFFCICLHIVRHLESQILDIQARLVALSKDFRGRRKVELVVGKEGENLGNVQDGCTAVAGSIAVSTVFVPQLASPKLVVVDENMEGACFLICHHFIQIEAKQREKRTRTICGERVDAHCIVE